MTVHLRILGPLELVATDGTEIRRILQQPKRLGLLIYLALQSPRQFHRRDALLARFWPDLDTEHARAALRRSLYFLRQELGEGVVVSRGDDEVGIAEARLLCDAVQFDANLPEHPDRALPLYRGHLLEAFFVAGAPDVVDWIDGERTRLRERAIRAAWAMTERPDVPPAVSLHWARWAADAAPDDESNVARYIALLTQRGERSQALHVFGELQRRLELQFGVAPSRTTMQLVEEARSADTAMPVMHRAAPAIAADSTSSDSARSGEDAQRVVVMPFMVRGGAAAQYLGEGVMELMSGALADAGDLHAVDAGAVQSELQRRPEASAAELATFFGAARFIDGTVFEAGGRLRLLASLRLADSRAVVARAEGEASSETELFALVDDVARQLVTPLAADPGARLARAAAGSVRSIPALKAFLRAERDFRGGRLFEAVTGFGEATRFDPGFAVAHFRLASALAAAAQVAQARQANARALGSPGHVGDREHAHFRAQEAWLYGDTAEAEVRYAGLLANWPEDLEAQYLLADLRMHTNPDRGRSVMEAKVPLKQALALDPGHVGARIKLARLAALEGRSARACEHVERALALSPQADQAIPMRALRACLQADKVEQSEVLGALQSARALTLMIAFSDVAVYGNDLAGAERFGASLTEIIQSEDLRVVSCLVRAYVALARGRIGAGLEMLRAQGAMRPLWARELAALAVAGSVFPDGSVPLGAMREEVAGWSDAEAGSRGFIPLTLHEGIHRHLQLYLLGLLDTRLGRVGDAGASAEALAEEPVPAGAEAVVPHLLRDLTAAIRERDGRVEEAMRIRSGRLRGVWYQFALGSPFLGGVESRYRMARALEDGGREREAIGWYASVAERSPWELPWKAPAALRLAGIHERLGEPSKAAEQYRLALSLWCDADACLQPLVSEARTRAAALGTM